MRNVGAPMVAEGIDEDHFFSILKRLDLRVRAPGARRVKMSLNIVPSKSKLPLSVLT